MKKVFLCLIAALALTTSCTKYSHTVLYSVGIIQGVSNYQFQSMSSIGDVTEYFKSKGFEESLVANGSSVADCDKVVKDHFEELIKKVSPEEIKSKCNLADTDFFEWCVIATEADGFTVIVAKYDYNMPE